MSGIQDLLIGILFFINFSVLPFLMGLAFLFFIWNMARYFIIQSESDKGHEKAKRNALYGILGFVVIASIWGVVNILTYGLGFSQDRIRPDYFYIAPDRSQYPGDVFPSSGNNEPGAGSGGGGNGLTPVF